MIIGTAKLFGANWSWFIAFGVVCTAIGLWGRFMDRNESKDEKERINNSYGGGPVYYLGFVGPISMLLGVVLLAI